jgi:hypothetical protein
LRPKESGHFERRDVNQPVDGCFSAEPAPSDRLAMKEGLRVHDVS